MSDTFQLTAYLTQACPSCSETRLSSSIRLALESLEVIKCNLSLQSMLVSSLRSPYRAHMSERERLDPNERYWRRPVSGE